MNDSLLAAAALAATFAACGMVALLGSRGRRLSRVVFFAVSALTLAAASSKGVAP